MSSYHELTQKIIDSVPGHGADEVVRQWLEEKGRRIEEICSTTQCANVFSDNGIRKVLGLTEESLESKFKTTLIPPGGFNTNDVSTLFTIFNRQIKQLVQIAKEHYEDKE